MLTGSLYYYTLLSKEFLLFSTMLISIEMIMPIRTTKAVHLMISFAIHTFENMRTWLTILGSQTSCFLVLHTTPYFLSMVFSNMSSIAIGTPGDVRSTTKCCMSPLPTVLALWNPQVHISPVNGRNKLFNVKSTIDNVLHTQTTLGISDVHPDHCHIRFRRSFDDVGF